MKRVLTLFLVFFLFLVEKNAYAQICGTPGYDGSMPIGGQVNTYYPAAANTTLLAGGNSVMLAQVPVDVNFNGGVNTYSKGQINLGDLLLIIQMQDATINSANSNLYGAGIANSGADQLGGTGYLDLGNTGLFEYVVATNDVPLTGGNLTFRGTGANAGAQNSYFNRDFDANDKTRGQRTFQIVRVPQYSNVQLVATIFAPPFNGKAGGIIAFDVAGRMDMNNFAIDANGRGFRGGFVYMHNTPGCEPTTYVNLSGNTTNATSGKGEGVVGTPKNMWDGFIQVDGGLEGMPNGSFGRGAPGNAGGGGNAHNSGGGGGGNGGSGGVGGAGFACKTPAGGRPGSNTGTPTPIRLIMGGGGGAGEVNNARRGTSGGVGGGIILLNVGTLSGNGIITSNGGAGQAAGWDQDVVNDGAGGGGAGGTVFLKVTNPDPKAVLTINAQGGKGGNAGTENNEHGPGGGGGGGLIFHSQGAIQTLNTNVVGGNNGTTTNGNSANGAGAGEAGKVIPWASLPPYLQGGGPVCFPELNVQLSESNAGVRGTRSVGSPVKYTLTISNKAGLGNAGGVIADLLLPAGITYQSVNVSYTGGSAGNAASTINQGTNSRPRFGNFVVAPGGSVILTLLAKVDCQAASGTYHASAQAYYLDPTRDKDPLQRITPSPAVFAFPLGLAVSTVYEAGEAVLGSNYNGLASTLEDVVVDGTVPYLSSALNAGFIQSGTLFSYTPTSDFVPSAGGGGLSLSWSRAAVPGISNPAATGNGSINEVLINTTTVVKQVAYVYTLQVNDCSFNSQSATVIVIVNPSDLTISANPALVKGGNTSIITVSLPPSVTAASPITFSPVRGGSAVNGVNYVGATIPASITIPTGARSVSFTLQTLSQNTLDLITELNLSGVLANYTIHGCVVTIADTINPERVIYISSGQVVEGGSIVLTASLSGSLKTFNPIAITLSPNPAFPAGYTIPNPITIPANAHSVDFIVQTVRDNRIGDFVLNIGGTATSFVVKEGTLRVTDLDIEGAVVTIGSGRVVEGQSIRLPVSLTRADGTSLITNVRLVVTLDDSPFPLGYSITPLQVVIAPGEGASTFEVKTSRDNNVGDVTYNLNGSLNIAGIAVTKGMLVVTDTDGNGGVRLIIGSGTVPEGSSGVLSVSLPNQMKTNNDLSIPINVNPVFQDGYKIDGRSVARGSNYVVVIPAGSNSVNYKVFASSDADFDDNIYQLSGTDVGNYMFSPGQLTVKDLTIKKLDVTNLITPNGDAYNACWILRGIEKYVDNEVSIIDRWGNALYKVRGYNNTSTVFCGTSNLGYGDFRSGSYYYVIKYRGLNSDGEPAEQVEGGYIVVLYGRGY